MAYQKQMANNLAINYHLHDHQGLDAQRGVRKGPLVPGRAGGLPAEPAPGLASGAGPPPDLPQPLQEELSGGPRLLQRGAGPQEQEKWV